MWGFLTTYERLENIFQTIFLVSRYCYKPTIGLFALPNFTGSKTVGRGFSHLG